MVPAEVTPLTRLSLNRTIGDRYSHPLVRPTAEMKAADRDRRSAFCFASIWSNLVQARRMRLCLPEHISYGKE